MIDGEPHSLVATDNYDSMVERITRSKLRYVAIDQGTFWMIVSNGPVSVGYGKNRKIVSEPIENLWKFLDQAFKDEPKSGSRLMTSRAWARGRVARYSPVMIEPSEQVSSQWSKDLSRAERSRLMVSIGVTIDPRASSYSVPMTPTQWAHAIENGWIVTKGTRPSKPRQPAPDRRASVIVLAEYARKKRTA